MPLCAGFVPVLVSVKTSVVALPSVIVAAPKVFATVGVPAVTTRQTSVDVLFAPVVVTEAEAFVNAAGFVAQEPLTWPVWFVRPATVTVQLAVPAVMARPVRPERTRVP